MNRQVVNTGKLTGLRYFIPAIKEFSNCVSFNNDLCKNFIKISVFKRGYIFLSQNEIDTLSLERFEILRSKFQFGTFEN